jgi:hypothetical protein
MSLMTLRNLALAISGLDDPDLFTKKGLPPAILEKAHNHV